VSSPEPFFSCFLRRRRLLPSPVLPWCRVAQMHELMQSVQPVASVGETIGSVFRSTLRPDWSRGLACDDMTRRTCWIKHRQMRVAWLYTIDQSRRILSHHVGDRTYYLGSQSADSLVSARGSFAQPHSIWKGKANTYLGGQPGLSRASPTPLGHSSGGPSQ